MDQTSAHRSECPLCRLDMSQALGEVSRHPTQDGTIVYARCDCGRLSVWLEPGSAALRLGRNQPQPCG